MCERLTLRTRDDWTALIFALLHGTLLADGLGEWTDAQIAHQHAVMASTVEAGLIRHDPVTLRVVVVIIIAAGLCKEQERFGSVVIPIPLGEMKQRRLRRRRQRVFAKYHNNRRLITRRVNYVLSS